MVLNTKNLLCSMEVCTSWSRKDARGVEEIYRALFEHSRALTEIPINFL